MHSWFFLIKMVFDFIKRIFGFLDEGPRKRRAEELENDHGEDITRAKKRCYSYDNSRKWERRFVDENTDDVEFIREQYNSTTSSKNQLNGASCIKRKQSVTFKTPLRQCSRNSVSQMNGKESKTNNLLPKGLGSVSRLGSDCLYSTLMKTNQLREKQQYGQMLQNFVPHRFQIARSRTEDDSKRQQSTEVIDLDKYETPSTSITERCTGKHKSREIFSTPMASTPLRWSQPRESGKHLFIRPKVKDDEVSIIATKKTTLPTAGTSARRPSLSSPVDSADEVSIISSRRSTTEKVEASTSRIEPSHHTETLKTNTLRDNLAAKAVMKQDFVPRISGHYNDRMEQRLKQAEELKRMTCLLSKHNRLAREAALASQLARSMRLCEAVLDETEDLEEAALPTLTPAMLEAVRNALVPHPPNEVLVESFGLRITRKDLHTLADLNWLNDEVINFYMNLLIVRGTEDKYPKVHAMNTFFYPKLLSGGHSSLKRWTRKIDIFAQDLFVVPIHLGIHWCMSVVDFRDKSIRYFDSMGGSNPKCLQALRQYLEDESLDKKKKPFDSNDWKLVSMKNIPQQMNGSDCGVFSCMFAEFICANRKISFTQQDMPYFRSKMVYEILKAKLL